MTRRTPAARVGAFLRNPRLGLVLLGLLIGLSFIGTVVPQTSRGPAEAAAWAASHTAIEPVARLLALHSIFSSPAFLLLVLMLVLSTAACAWQRTGVSVRAWREGPLPQSVVKRLAAHPAATYPVPPEISDGDARGRAASSLRAIRLHVEQHDQTIRGEAGRFGLLGSPVFHWTLVALVLVVGLGRLTRWEGAIGVPVGHVVPNTAASYRGLEKGPLTPGPEGGLGIGVKELIVDYRQGATDRGQASFVTVYKGGSPVASQRVYANSPLRYGSLLIHQNDVGYAGVVSIESTGSDAASTTVLVDFAPGTKLGVKPQSLDVDVPGAPTGQLTVAILPRAGSVGATPPPARALVGVRFQGANATYTITGGQSVPLPGGARMRLSDLSYYARLSVADDWSIYPMYFLFGLTTIGLSIAVFAPRRTVWLLLIDSHEGRQLNVVVRHARRDPAFAVRVKEAIESSMDPRPKE